MTGFPSFSRLNNIPMCVCVYTQDCCIIEYFYFLKLFEDPSVLFYIMAAPIHICTVDRVPFSLHPHQHFIFLLFGHSYPNRCEVIFYSGLDCILCWLVMLGIFLHTCWPFVCLLWKNVYSCSLPIFNFLGGWFIWFFTIELYEFLIYFGY